MRFFQLLHPGQHLFQGGLRSPGGADLLALAAGLQPGWHGDVGPCGEKDVWGGSLHQSRGPGEGGQRRGDIHTLQALKLRQELVAMEKQFVHITLTILAGLVSTR